MHLQHPVFIIPFPKRQGSVHLFIELIGRGGGTAGVFRVEGETVPTDLARTVKRLVDRYLGLEKKRRNGK
jgi:hypothetical protein